jgi:signal transduction histidine kinase
MGSRPASDQFSAGASRLRTATSDRLARTRSGAREERHTEQVAAATAAERAAIARELHDIVAHAVSVIVISAQAGSRALPAKIDVAAEVLTTIETSARTALAELRRLLTLLAADDESAATAPAASLRHLPDLLEGCRRSGLDVDVDLDDLPSLPPASDLAAYRVIQESLTNTLRHAPGATAKLSIRRDGKFLDIVAIDEGASVETAKPDAGDGTGRGLIGMRERLAMVGGRLVGAGPHESGYRVHAIIPLDGAELTTATAVVGETAR